MPFVLFVDTVGFLGHFLFNCSVCAEKSGVVLMDLPVLLLSLFQCQLFLSFL